MYNFGRYYEDFIVGVTIKHALAKTITESDNNLFCLLTMNHHPLHLNKEYAAQQRHGKIVVVGTYVVSLVVGLTVADISGKAIANLNYKDIEHLRPVFVGDTISAATVILSKRESKSRPEVGIVKVKTIAKNQEGQVVLVLVRTIMIPKGDKTCVK